MLEASTKINVYCFARAARQGVETDNKELLKATIYADIYANRGGKRVQNLYLYNVHIARIKDSLNEPSIAPQQCSDEYPEAY